MGDIFPDKTDEEKREIAERAVEIINRNYRENLENE